LHTIRGVANESPERAADAVARRITSSVLDGRLPPGARLREVSLAEEYGVSRTPVREALMMLSTLGLVALTPNRGATVLELTAADITDVYLVRGVLEAEAARLAATAPTPELAASMKDSIARLATLHDAPAARQLAADTAFHYAIAQASGSSRLHAMIRQVSALPEAYRSTTPYTAADMRAAAQQHRAVATAIVRRRPDEAATAMRAHVAWAGDLAARRMVHSCSAEVADDAV